MGGCMIVYSERQFFKISRLNELHMMFVNLKDNFKSQDCIAIALWEMEDSVLPLLGTKSQDTSVSAALIFLSFLIYLL